MSVLAAPPVTTGSVTITVNGNKNLQVTLDGNNYNLNNSTIEGNKTTLGCSNVPSNQVEVNDYNTFKAGLP